MQVESDTVASDSFMVNLQSMLLRFVEPYGCEIYKGSKQQAMKLCNGSGEKVEGV
ncbi:hypothetical protein BDR06DRAFT_951886 [Suillus hirtellus]|nr:hypothetical protein BDR06DRAFT_951886 [Suillus hirtellus]